MLDDNQLLRDTTCVRVLVTTLTSGNLPISSKAAETRITLRVGQQEHDAEMEALQSRHGHGEKLEMLFVERKCEILLEGLPLAIVPMSHLTLNLAELLLYLQISNDLSEPRLDSNVELPRLTVEGVQCMKMKQTERQNSLPKSFVMHMHALPGSACAGLSKLKVLNLRIWDTNTWQLDMETMTKTISYAMHALFSASYQLLLPVSTLTLRTLVDVFKSDEGCSLHVLPLCRILLPCHILFQPMMLEKVLRQPEELQQILTRTYCCLLDLLPQRELHLQRRLRDDRFLSLIPYVYALAKKAVPTWIRDDETCGDCLVEVACNIALAYQHKDVAAYLFEILKAANVSGTIRHYLSGNRLSCYIFLFSVQLIVSLDLYIALRRMAFRAQLLSIKALRSIGSCSRRGMRMKHVRQLGEFALEDT